MSRRSVALAMLMVLAAGAAFAGSRRPGRDIAAETRELIIRQAYANLTERVAAGGVGISFRIDNLRTVEAAELDQVQWLDLATLPGGDMIDMARDVKQRDGVTVAVVYHPQWKAAVADYLQGPEGASLVGRSAAEVLADLAKKKPAVASTVAVTSFDVLAALAGQSRSYRAAVLWLPPEPGRDATLFFMDHITQGLEEAVRERPITARPPAPRPKVYGASCYANNTTARANEFQSGSNGHFWGVGFHSAEAQADYNCRCSADCSQECSVNFSVLDCSDTGGNYDACHVMTSAVAQSIGSTDDGRTTGTQCTGGFMCAEKACLFCVCGLRISVTIRDFHAEFTESETPDWKVQWEFNHRCGTCTEVPPPPPDGGGGLGDDGGVQNRDFNPPPGGGGGGGLCCLAWATSCYTDSNGVYQCRITGSCLLPC